MATRLKTVQYSFPTLAALADNTTTTLTQITVYLPETGTKTFRKVIAKVTADDFTTTAASLATRTVSLRLGAAGYTSVSNTNTLTNSGLGISVLCSGDFTAHFTSNWSGASMTCDMQVLIDGATTGMINVSVTLDITYEYDDTSTTQVKTVWIPLNAPVGALGTSKPGTADDTIPALDTYLPEASKTYRDMFVVMQGNNASVATTDFALSMQIDTYTAATGSTIEGTATAARWMRYVWNINGINVGGFMTTNASHGFYIWASVARFNHVQVWLAVTYEFNASTTSSVMQSLMLPMELASPMGGTAATDYQRGTRELFVQEPSTISLQRLALYLHWDQSTAIAGLNMRIGTGSFVTYTDAAAVLAGGNGCMIRNDAPTGITLARGRNTLQADIYRTDTTDLGGNLSGFWIINYTSGKHTDGVGAHNRTVFWNLTTTGTAAATEINTISATAPVIPEADYYLTALGTRYEYISNTTATPAGVSVLVERLAAEGGIKWESAYTDISETDPEVGLRNCYSQLKEIFWRWPNDTTDTNRMNLQTARRWRTLLANNATSYDNLDLIFSYHTIAFAAADSIAGFSGTVALKLCRAANGEIVKSTTRAGDGSFTFTWYDNTENIYITANDGTHVGRSMDSLAA